MLKGTEKFYQANSCCGKIMADKVEFKAKLLIQIKNIF